jgi:cell division septation protein DedD
LLAVAALAASPAAADVKAGVDAWSAGDYPAAIQQWQPLAAKGDADAQFNLAQAYKMGRGVALDLRKAEELYGKAAAQGHVQASDTYGLMLFQRGERQKAMPFIQASAARGDARAEYLLGVAHFNGDIVAKDWVRAYALVTLAQRGGLPQAASALAQMDTHVSLEDRQKSVALASELSSRAESSRINQIAGAELGSGPKAIATDSPASAGADYTLTRSLPLPAKPGTAPSAQLAQRPSQPPKLTAQQKSPPQTVARVPSPPAGGGIWRLQLGAFGVPGNAEKLWASLSKRPEMVGSRRVLVPAGKLTKLYAAGFSSKAQAVKACGALKATGQECIVTS